MPDNAAAFHSAVAKIRLDHACSFSAIDASQGNARISGLGRGKKQEIQQPPTPGDPSGLVNPTQAEEMA